MARVDLIVRQGILVDGHQETSADVGVRDGKICFVGKSEGVLEADRVIDVRGCHVLPGIIDSHVHVRDPGLTVKEDFRTASMAAAAGGVTTIMCQPTTVPPTTTEAAFEERIALGESKSLVDFAIQAGVSIDNLSHVAALAKCGAASLEVFLQDFPAELATRDAAALWRVLEAVTETGCVAGVFRGDESLKNLFADRVKSSGRVDLLAWSDSRPAILEAIGVAVTLSVAAEVGCPVHLRQISTKAAMDMILAMKGLHPSLSVSVEVTPHNLVTTREDFLRQGAFGKVIPPQREKADLQALWRAIAEREIEMVVATDHAPHPKKDKAVGAENVWSSPPGFPGVQTMLPLMLNEVSAGVLSLNRLVELCSETPARVFGIFPRKGALAIGSDADMTIVDMHREAIIRSSDQHTKAGFTPFDGWKVKGQPVMTIVTGKVVMENGKLVEDGPRGKFVAGRMLAR